MTAQEISALLGRPLTANETTDLKTYLEIAKESLFGQGGLLCIDPTVDTGERVFDKREGYSTVFTGVFTQLNSVTVDGNIVEATPYLWNSRNSEVYNSIVLDVNCGQEVVVDAEWGFDCYPKDLQRLLAAAFDNITKQNKLDRTINSKKIEDFSVSYNHSSITYDGTPWTNMIRDFDSVIRKYSMCDLEYGIRNGKVNKC